MTDHKKSVLSPESQQKLKEAMSKAPHAAYYELMYFEKVRDRCGDPDVLSAYWVCYISSTNRQKERDFLHAEGRGTTPDEAAEDVIGDWDRELNRRERLLRALSMSVADAFKAGLLYEDVRLMEDGVPGDVYYQCPCPGEPEYVMVSVMGHPPSKTHLSELHWPSDY